MTSSVEQLGESLMEQVASLDGIYSMLEGASLTNASSVSLKDALPSPTTYDQKMSLKEFYSVVPRSKAHDSTCLDDEAQMTVRAWAGSIKAYLKKCESLQEDIDSAIELLKRMGAQHALVKDNTSSLHDTCERLLGEQLKLEAQVKYLEEPLSYFESLREIGTLLGLPVESETRGQVTLGVPTTAKCHPDEAPYAAALTRLDECIQYMETHREFKDATVYRAKFRELQVFGLGRAKEEVVKTLEIVAQQLLSAQAVQQEIINGGIEKLELSSYYSRFQGIASRIGTMTDLIEERASSREIAAMVLDCHQAYYHQRTLLLTPIVTAHMEGLAAATVRQESIISSLRTGSSYMVKICLLEYQLFVQFFCQSAQSKRVDEARAGVRSMLVDICGVLYSHLRTLIIHQDNMDTLCEIIHIAKVEVTDELIRPRGKAAEALEQVLYRFVQDAQETLIFCAERYVGDEIEGYEPTAADLDYPAKLEAQAAQNTSRPTNMYASWYPTLERTLMCLSKLYRNVDMNIFEKVAQEAVSVCADTLKEAAKRIGTAKSSIDGELFLIKNLLTLREQMTPFDINFSVMERTLDFSSTAGAISHLWANPNISGLFSMTSNPLFTVLTTGLPKIAEEKVDTKKNLERELKLACNVYIENTTALLSNPLSVFLAKANAFAVSGESIATQSFAQPDKVQEVLKDATERIDAELPRIFIKMRLYLANVETESILFKPIQSNVFETIDKFRATLTGFSSDDQKHFEKGIQSLIKLMTAPPPSG